jgi:hypothetical protein
MTPVDRRAVMQMVIQAPNVAHKVSLLGRSFSCRIGNAKSRASVVQTSVATACCTVVVLLDTIQDR